jgi:phosphoglycolate phosphatase
VGNGIRKLIERALPEGTGDETIDKVFCEFNKYYAVHCTDYTRPYDGVIELIKGLRKNGIKTAVVSNKADYGVQELCKKYFDGLFDYAVGEREGINRKPSPDAVFEVLSYLDVEKDEAVYVGDSEVDIKTAKNAGMESIIVTWGFRDRDYLIEQGAVNIVDDCKQLVCLLK